MLGNRAVCENALCELPGTAAPTQFVTYYAADADTVYYADCTNVEFYAGSSETVVYA
jgi:hypothetical protein